MTLLLNKQNVLPLKRGNLTVAVMGPNAKDSVMMWGNYNGVPAHTVTVLDGIRAALGKGDKLIYEQGCPCVGDDLLESVFSECKSEGRPGFSARYWNNVNHEGKVDVETRVMTPFNFCTSGATVFAPGVNLTDFSATYNATYVPKASGEVIFDVYSFGKGRLLVNQKEAMSFYNSHGGNKQSYALQVEAGKKYDIELQFEYLQSDAQLNFDMGFKRKWILPNLLMRFGMPMSLFSWEVFPRAWKVRKWVSICLALRRETVPALNCRKYSGIYLLPCIVQGKR